MSLRYRRPVAEDSAKYSKVEHSPWSPAQVVGLAAGIFLTVVGGVALARAGLHFGVLPLTHVQVAGLGFTSLSGLVTLVAGVIVLAGSAYPYAAKGTMAVMGTLLLIWGLIVAITPASFFADWNYQASDGVAYAVIGAVLILAAAISPVFFSRRMFRREQW